METEIRKEYQNLPKDQHNSLKSTEDRQIETYYIYIKLHFTWSKQWPYISPSFINTNPSIIGFIDSSPLKKETNLWGENGDSSWKAWRILNLESIIRHGEGQFSVSKRTSNFVSDTQTRENPTAQSKPHGLRQMHCHFQRHSHFYL